MENVNEISKVKNKENVFLNVLSGFGNFVKQYTEWIDAADNLLAEIFKTQQYKEQLMRAYKLNDEQFLLSIFRELTKKRQSDFNNKYKEYKKCQDKLQKEHYDSENRAIKDLNHKLKNKKKVIISKYGFIKGNKKFRILKRSITEDLDKYYNERLLYWNQFTIDDELILRMKEVKKEINDSMAFYTYVFKRIKKLDSKKQNKEFLLAQQSQFIKDEPSLIE